MIPVRCQSDSTNPHFSMEKNLLRNLSSSVIPFWLKQSKMTSRKPVYESISPGTAEGLGHGMFHGFLLISGSF